MRLINVKTCFRNSEILSKTEGEKKLSLSVISAFDLELRISFSFTYLTPEVNKMFLIYG